ncbi:MAG: hypothetical protein EOQ69_04145 [Mesorhizobium sp.]|nr:MAG: hypothetical protein EOQ69_04145 [Mesorhizobium sp.]
MAQFENRWPLGTAARTCYGLALWLGNRRGDVAGLRWDQRVTRRVFIDGVERHFDGFDIVQAKNKGRTGGKRLFVPITPMLSEILDAADTRGETVLVNGYGEPFSAKSLTGMMAHWCKLAGLPKGLTLHGLRKSLGVYLAEAEASTRQLMDVLGHDDIDHAELYSREASQVRLAVQGMDRVVRLVTRKPMLGEPIGEPRGELPYKALINNDNGGPGGRSKFIDFTSFFAGQNRKRSRTIPYHPVGVSSLLPHDPDMSRATFASLALAPSHSKRWGRRLKSAHSDQKKVG